MTDRYPPDEDSDLDDEIDPTDVEDSDVIDYPAQLLAAMRKMNGEVSIKISERCKECERDFGDNIHLRRAESGEWVAYCQHCAASGRPD